MARSSGCRDTYIAIGADPALDVDVAVGHSPASRDQPVAEVNVQNPGWQVTVTLPTSPGTDSDVLHRDCGKTMIELAQLYSGHMQPDAFGFADC